MSKFYVGQRVRIDCKNSLNGHHGKETIITYIYMCIKGRYVKEGWIPYVGILHRTDLPDIAHNGKNCAYTANELIPLYDGDSASDFSFTEIMDRLKTNQLESAR